MLTQEAHNVNHDGIARKVLKARRKAWIIRGRRTPQKIVDGCIICSKSRAVKSQQIMADLPSERTEPKLSKSGRNGSKKWDGMVLEN